MHKAPRNLAMVTLKPELATAPRMKQYPFFNDLPLIFLGEIPNMPEHGVFVGHKSGRIYSGYHIFNFTEVPDAVVPAAPVNKNGMSRQPIVET